MGTNNLVFGLFALGAGLLFCFFGARILRFAIAVWGAFVGFAIGAALFAGWFSQGVLMTATAWFAAIGLAALFSVLAYVYYVFAIAVVVGSFAYGLSMTAYSALMAQPGSLAVVVSLVVAVLLAALTIALHVPVWLLIVVSAFDGAAAAIVGAGYLLGSFTVEDGITGLVRGDAGLWATLASFILAVLGIIVQGRSHRRGLARAEESWRAT